MWKKVGNRLIHTTDKDRITVQVRIDKNTLKELNRLAEEHYSTVSYLIENGIRNMLENQIVHPDYCRDIHNRKAFRLGIDKELYDELMMFIKEKGLKRSDMLEDSIHYIEYDKIKDRSWRYRIE